LGTGADARDRVIALLDGYLMDPESGERSIVQARAILPAEAVANLDAVLSHKYLSYRDGIMIQLAYGLEVPEADLTQRQEGARGFAADLGTFLAQSHIAGVKDAYQNIGKNNVSLTRGNVLEFDAFLQWASGADQQSREAALRLACAAVAATARPVLPMPELNRSSLTFVRVAALLHCLLDIPSGGAFEQFSVAALLHTLVDNHGEGRFRVETKNLNASDRSAFVAGDIQVASGSRVLEAIEVTANDWRTKLAGASKTIRDNDLSRLHIVAARPEGDRAAVIEALRELTEDVSLLDARQTVEVLVAVLTRPQRADALVRLYEYLDRYQPDTGRVNLFVERLTAAGLVERAGD
jgi:ribosomal protein L7/L12